MSVLSMDLADIWDVISGLHLYVNNLYVNNL